jgi:hypothetical protein
LPLFADFCEPMSLRMSLVLKTCEELPYLFSGSALC